MRIALPERGELELVVIDEGGDGHRWELQRHHTREPVAWSETRWPDVRDCIRNGYLVTGKLPRGYTLTLATAYAIGT